MDERQRITVSELAVAVSESMPPTDFNKTHPSATNQEETDNTCFYAIKCFLAARERAAETFDRLLEKYRSDDPDRDPFLLMEALNAEEQDALNHPPRILGFTNVHMNFAVLTVAALLERPLGRVYSDSTFPKPHDYLQDWPNPRP